MVCIIKRYRREKLHSPITNGLLSSPRTYIIQPLRATSFIENIEMHLQFISFLHTDIVQVVEIFPRARQELTYFTVKIMGTDGLSPVLK